jgi:alpha-beta hydrolase superfamily lysophospholipase
MGVVEHALVLLRAAYSVSLMDARAHGESGGKIATYGWLERKDTGAIIHALLATEHPTRIFALGESMGAGIALQSAAVDPRIEAVVAEASFASLREA